MYLTYLNMAIFSAHEISSVTNHVMQVRVKKEATAILITGRGGV
jgi:hypothetical protein